MKPIIDHLEANGSVDDECVAYAKPGDYPFTLEEFRTFTDKIWADAGGWDASDKYFVEGAYFETYYVPFEYENKKFILNIMYGQGSAWTLHTEASHEEYKKRVADLESEE